MHPEMEPVVKWNALAQARDKQYWTDYEVAWNEYILTVCSCAAVQPDNQGSPTCVSSSFDPAQVRVQLRPDVTRICTVTCTCPYMTVPCLLLTSASASAPRQKKSWFTVAGSVSLAVRPSVWLARL